jgi:predicted lipid-binding transport protein (Tim44 family)
MKLRTLFTAALALLAASLLALPESADAKRFGGGGNVGKQYNTMPRQAQPPQQTQKATPSQGQAAAAQRAPQASGASRWLGPLAGLAAGGLLASLFFGDAFSGLQVMDFLLIALLVFGAVMLFRMLRRGQAGPTSAAAGAFGSAPPIGAATAPSRDVYARASAPEMTPDLSANPSKRGEADAAGSGHRSSGFIPPGMGAMPPQPAGTDQFPHWFDGIAFIEGAKTHFIRLQAAWDQGDFQDIRDYTTPQLFAQLQRERERLGGTQYTEVVRLQAQLLTLHQDDDLAVASVRFSGLIREEEQAVAGEFNEVWHVQHPWASPEGDWHIAGIQQV